MEEYSERRRQIASLSQDLDALCQRSAARKKESPTAATAGGPSSSHHPHSSAEYSAEFKAFRQQQSSNNNPSSSSSSNNTQRKHSSSSGCGRKGLRLELRSPCAAELGSSHIITPGNLESPISPSVAVSLAKDESGDRGELEGEGGHQICFGMEVSGITEDGNGNKPRGSSAEDSSGVSSIITNSEHLHPTHRVTHTFIPRHSEEVLLEIGDPIHVDREWEDHWSHGTNLRSGQSGIFPAAHVFETVFDEEEDYLLSGDGGQSSVGGSGKGLVGGSGTGMGLGLLERDTFYVTYLGSLGVAHHKGNDVLVQSINKVLGMYQNKEELVVPKPVILDISFRGIHMIDKNNRNVGLFPWFRCPNFDYFYSLQNISFCGSHPKQLRYFGFITKHPLLPRFASHVFLSNVSTQPIVEALGRAFKKSYDEYMAFQHPTEDIYLE